MASQTMDALVIWTGYAASIMIRIPIGAHFQDAEAFPLNLVEEMLKVSLDHVLTN